MEHEPGRNKCLLKSPVALLAAVSCGTHVRACTLRSAKPRRLATDDFSGAFKALRYAAVKEKSCVYRILPSPVALLAAWRGRHEKTGNPCDCRFDVYDGHAVRLW